MTPTPQTEMGKKISETEKEKGKTCQAIWA